MCRISSSDCIARFDENAIKIVTSILVKRVAITKSTDKKRVQISKERKRKWDLINGEKKLIK